MGRAFNASLLLGMALQGTSMIQKTNAERWWLKDAYATYPNTLEVLHAFTVAVATDKEDGITNKQGQYGLSGQIAEQDLPSVQADEKGSHNFDITRGETTVNFVGPITTDSAIQSKGLQVSILHHSEYDQLAHGSMCKEVDVGGETWKVLETTSAGVAQGHSAEEKAETGKNKKVQPDDATQTSAGQTAKHAWSWRLMPDALGNNQGRAKPKSSPKNAEQAAASGGYQVAVSGKIAVITKPGVYYVTVSNCDTLPEQKTKFLSGEVEMKSPYGYLPGEELPKLKFYGYLSLIYLAGSIVWSIICARWSGANPPVLLPIHRWIGYAFMAGIFEAVCWYVSLYHWNLIGHRWWSMIALACFSTLAKQGTCLACLLAVAIGSGITKAQLERKTTIKIMMLVAAFVVTDGARAFEMYTLGAGNNSLNWFKPPRADEPQTGTPATTWGSWFAVLLVIAPGTFFLVALLCWIVEELDLTIQHLIETGQTIKLKVYQDLRVCLGVVMAVALCLLSYETWVLREQPLSSTWSQRWIFSDLCTHVAFLCALVATASLWRPSERMAQMAFSTQLGPKGDANPNGMGMGGDVEMVGGSLDDVVDDLKPTYDDDDVQDERVKV